MAIRVGAVESMGVIESFWRGKRVLVTGHTGFKGGWLSQWLLSLQAKVTGLALAPCSPGFFQAVRLHEAINNVIGDIRGFEIVEKTFRDAKPEIVFHMAAQPLVRASYREPLETYATNIMGTAHVLEAVRRIPGVRAVVVVTSDKSYENREWPWGYRETDRLGGHDPYSSSKACAEIVSAAYRSSYFTAPQGRCGIATARAGNVIGGGDWSEDRLVPDIVRSVSGGIGLAIRNPSAIRPWQHVLEPLRGYLMLAECLAGSDPAAYAEGWNFGPHDTDARTVGWIAKRFLALWGSPQELHMETGEQPHETHLLKLDVSKAKAKLGWKPALGIDQALADTVAWYKQHEAGEDMHQFSLGQIDAYMKTVRNGNDSSGVAP